MSRFCLGFLAVAAIAMCGCDDSKSSENGDCQEAQSRCLNGVRQVCSAAGAWQDVPCTGAGEVCSDATGTAICAKGGASGTCEADQTRCYGGVLQTCNASKQWANTPCTGEGEVCSDVSGKAKCEKGGIQKDCSFNATQCVGKKLQRCSAAGQWEDVPCTGAGEVCSDASGTAKCEVSSSGGDCGVGEVRCNDNGTTAELWTCDENLQWKKTPCPASDVTGARLSCKNADSCVTYICTTTGEFYNSATKECTKNVHSNACKQGRTYCNGDTNFLYECLATDNEAPLAATDCGAEGKTCIKIDDDNSVCVKEECEEQFCDGETLVFCKDHKIELDDNGERVTMSCAETDRVCDLDGEFKIWMCKAPCTEGEQFCEDENSAQYSECKDGHFGLPHTCPDGKACVAGEGNTIQCI